MKNKEKLKEAIKNIEKYSDAQSKVAEVLIELEKNYEAIISIQNLTKETRLTKPTVYTAIDLFVKDGLLTKSTNFKNTYIFNEERAQEIIGYYDHLKEYKLKTNSI